MSETARLRLPILAAAQAQKHVTHNEALIYLDTLVQASVLDKDLAAPPGSPEEGDCYIVAGGGGTASGAWISWEKRIARFQDGEWISLLPGQGDGAGWLVWVQDEDAMYRFDGTDWGLAGIEGPPGADGQSFTVDATGVFSARTLYDGETAGFAFLATDTGDLYIKETGPGSWSDPIGFQGPPGPAGADGADGLDGLNPGLPWLFATSTTMADPGAGNIRLNNATLASVTALALAAGDAETGNPDVSDFLTAWDDGTTVGDKGVLLIKKWSASQNFALYRVTAAFTDSTSWLQATVTHLASAGSFSAGDKLAVEFLKTGDRGADGAGTGDMIAANNLSDVASAATAFANIKQAATASVTGVVELATDAETQAGTDTARAITPANLTAKEASVAEFRANTADRILTTDIVWSGAGLVTLTDGATITPDFGAGLNFVVTLGGNRTLANPSNLKAGQAGIFLVKQDGTGSRTLAYSSYWKFPGGTAPTLTTIAGKTDKLFYFVESSTIIHASLEKNSA